MTTNLNKVIEEWIGFDYTEHICRFNDGDCKCECYGEALADLRSRTPELEEKITKAFGGCTNCYGKGYATVKVNHVGRNYFKEANPMKFCDCDRGKQLSELLTSKE